MKYLVIALSIGAIALVGCGGKGSTAAQEANNICGEVGIAYLNVDDDSAYNIDELQCNKAPR